MTTTSIYELVRKDLLERERQDVANFGAPRLGYQGRAAILDAYDSAIDLACYLRQVIEGMTVGDGRFDEVPEYGQ